MQICVRLPQPDVELEQMVFALGRRLDRYCGSLANCTVSIEDRDAPESTAPESTVSESTASELAVRLLLTVYGESIEVAAAASGPSRQKALEQALRAVFEQSRARLAGIAVEHCGCGCGCEEIQPSG